MKAAPLKERPAFPLMKQTDIQSVFHLQMPRWLFTDPSYSGLSLEAKVVYTFLLNRFQLSKLNGWTNESGEVFIIYTRASLAREIQISYRKVIEAMKELSAAKLVWEKRCGRGDANQIYLAFVTHERSEGGSAPFVDPEDESHGGEPELDGDGRNADPALLADGEGGPVQENEGARSAQTASLVAQEVRDTHVKTCGDGTSASAGLGGLEVPDPHPSKINLSKTDGSFHDVSPSVIPAGAQTQDGQAAEIAQLNEILEQCELWTFEPETAKVFESAIERLFFSTTFKIGNAVLPQAKVRSHLWELDAMKLKAAEDKIHRNTQREIKNSTAYTMAVIFNTIWESESDLMLDPYLNHLRQLPVRGGAPEGGGGPCF